MFENKGLTSQGYIDNPYSVEHIQPDFSSVVEQMLRRLKETFPDQLHSVYLYGSVPRGKAVFGQSDLDVSVVFYQPLSSNDHKQLQRIADELTSQYSAISKLDFDPGHLQEVLAEEEEYRWQFWLKHCCCCLWGQDLSTGFRLHKPSLRIAWQLNEDLPQVLESELESIQTQDEKANAKVLGKKLLRSAYLLVAEQDNSWLSDLDSITKVLRQYYPDDVTSIELCLRLAQGECGNVHRINELISGFGYKVVKQIEKAKA
ncbi:nucleotidyltransferase domain-containing protein [Vibrio sinaloensis]|uniref:nucleotidyltransferase domain-containing protein n=1 Tax=Photobacterium sp. (strain ATCC 43367) TaxID=379097 RepID=UPI0005806936|nr:nucleotidyltransferase domain-containing protein [Vibrio sinaloensis]KHT44061.1 nucleotidyltransferase [Vibrio sinaloensis]